MSFEAIGTDISLLAAADQSTSQYLAGSVDTNGKFVVASAAGQSCIGVLQNNPGTGQPAAVRVYGVTKMVAGAALSAGALIKADAAGKAQTAAKTTTNTSDAGASNDPAVGSDVIGVALKAAGGAGEIIPVLLQIRGGVPTTAA